MVTGFLFFGFFFWIGEILDIFHQQVISYPHDFNHQVPDDDQK